MQVETEPRLRIIQMPRIKLTGSNLKIKDMTLATFIYVVLQ